MKKQDAKVSRWSGTPKRPRSATSVSSSSSSSTEHTNAANLFGKGALIIGFAFLTIALTLSRIPTRQDDMEQFILNYRGDDGTMSTTTTTTTTAMNHLRSYASLTVDMSRNDPALRGLRYAECRYFLATSAIPNAGWGVYTAMDIPRKAQAQNVPDLCFAIPRAAAQDFARILSVAPHIDNNRDNDAKRVFVCQGFSSLMNHMPDDDSRAATSKFVAPHPLVDHDDDYTKNNKDSDAVLELQEQLSTITNHKVKAGAELTIDYGGKSQARYFPKGLATTAIPERLPEWLREHGLCLDQIQVKTSTMRPLGREMLGAFSARRIERGALVAPTPLLTIYASSEWALTDELIVNYCFRVPGTERLLFPYGPGVGYINHHSTEPNVALRWSESSTVPNSNMLRRELEGMTTDEISLSHLILEVYALRNIVAGEELLLDYGNDFVNAWGNYEKDNSRSMNNPPYFRHAIALPRDMLPMDGSTQTAL